VCPPPPTREITLCYVTDRKGLGVSPEKQCEALVGRMEIAARAGVDWIQLREKDLSGRALAELLREALRRVPAGCRIVLNDRLDVACALGAGGVHLGRESLSVEDARRLAIGGITVENARACLEAGAAGIAAIRLFEEASDLPAVVDALRRP